MRRECLGWLNERPQSVIYVGGLWRASQLCARGGSLAVEHSRNREQALFAGALAFVIVGEFERAVPQFHDRHVRGRGRR